MDMKEILDYAIKGLESEISAIESKIDRGYNLIDEINRNIAKTTKSRQEILKSIEKYQQKRNALIKKKR